MHYIQDQDDIGWNLRLVIDKHAHSCTKMLASLVWKQMSVMSRSQTWATWLKLKHYNKHQSFISCHVTASMDGQWPQQFIPLQPLLLWLQVQLWSAGFAQWQHLPAQLFAWAVHLQRWRRGGVYLHLDAGTCGSAIARCHSCRPLGVFFGFWEFSWGILNGLAWLSCHLKMRSFLG